MKDYNEFLKKILLENNNILENDPLVKSKRSATVFQSVLNREIDKDFDEFLKSYSFIKTNNIYNKNGITNGIMKCYLQKDIAVQCTTKCLGKCKFCCWYDTSLDSLEDRFEEEHIKIGFRLKEEIPLWQLSDYIETMNIKTEYNNVFNMVYLEILDDPKRSLPTLKILHETNSSVLLYTNALNLSTDIKNYILENNIKIKGEIRVNIGVLREYSENKDILFYKWLDNVKFLSTICENIFLESPSIPDTINWIKNKREDLSSVLKGYIISELHLRGLSNMEFWQNKEGMPLIQYYGAAVIPLYSKYYMKEMITEIHKSSNIDNLKLIIQDTRFKLLRDVDDHGRICKDVYKNYDRKHFVHMIEHLKGE